MNKRLALPVVVGVLIILAIIAAAIETAGHTQPLTTPPVATTSSSTDIATSTPQDASIQMTSDATQHVIGTQPANLTILYRTNIGAAATANRDYGIWDLWLKAGNAAPQLLGTFGGKGSFVDEVVASPDHSMLAINLEQKLVILNVATKQVRTVFTPIRAVGEGVAFSPDSSKIAFVDGSYYATTFNNPDGNGSALHILDLKTGNDQIVNQTADITYTGILAWRADDALILSNAEPKDGPSPILYYLPKDGSTHDFSPAVSLLDSNLSNPLGYGGGKLFLEETDSLSPCNFEDVGDGAPSAVTIVDPLTGTTYVSLQEPSDTMIAPIESSADGTQIFYGLLSGADCNPDSTATPPTKYFIQTLQAGSQPVPVASRLAAYSAWQQPLVEVNQDTATHSNLLFDQAWDISVNGTPVVRANGEELDLISSYIQ